MEEEGKKAYNQWIMNHINECQKIESQCWGTTNECIRKLQNAMKNLSIEKNQLKKIYDEGNSYLHGKYYSAEGEIRRHAVWVLEGQGDDSLKEVVKDIIRKFQEDRKSMRYLLKHIKKRLDHDYE